VLHPLKLTSWLNGRTFNKLSKLKLKVLPLLQLLTSWTNGQTLRRPLRLKLRFFMMTQFISRPLKRWPLLKALKLKNIQFILKMAIFLVFGESQERKLVQMIPNFQS